MTDQPSTIDDFLVDEVRQARADQTKAHESELDLPDVIIRPGVNVDEQIASTAANRRLLAHTEKRDWLIEVFDGFLAVQQATLTAPDDAALRLQLVDLAARALGWVSAIDSRGDPQ